MKKLFVVFLFLSILSCSGGNKNEIPVFNEITFQLKEGESIGNIDSEIKNQYADYFNDGSIQMPLFKYIKHKNYRIFIGLPFNTTIEEMTEDQVNEQDSLATSLKFESDSISYFKEYEKNNLHFTEYAIKQKENSLIFISTLSDSSVFNSKSDISNRINLKN